MENTTITNFQALNLTPQLMRGIEKMDYKTLSPVQEAAIGPIMEKRDVFVQAPTGTGKTAAFGIPVIENTQVDSTYIQTVILCPTRELAIQTDEVLKKLTAYKEGVRVLALYGGQPIQHQIKALKRRPQIIVATPGRMIDHINRRTVRLNQVNCVVLDEADCMLDMGFREDIESILKNTPGAKQTVLLSATIPAEIKRIAQTYQKEAEHIVIRANTTATAQIEQFSLEVKGNVKTEALMQLIKEKKFSRSLIFVETKAMAKTLAKQLAQAGHLADAIHGDLRQSQRNNVMQCYKRGKVKILVATDVAARGIDVNDIEAVVNYDIPRDPNSYIHRIGRTGRAQRSGVAYTLVSTRERSKLQYVMKSTKSQITPFHLESTDFEPLAPMIKERPMKERPMRDSASQERFSQEKSSKGRYGKGNMDFAKKRGAKPAGRKPGGKSWNSKKFLSA